MIPLLYSHFHKILTAVLKIPTSLHSTHCGSVVCVDQQLFCPTLLQYPPISSDLHFCQQTPLSIHTALLLPQHLLTQPLHNNQTIWITHWHTACSSFFAYQKSKRRIFLYLSRRQHLMLHQAGWCLLGLQSLQPSSHKPTF